MSLNPIAANHNWNYSNPNKPDYSTQLVGTVVAIQEVQKMGFTMNGQPGAPEFWPDGNPKMNIRLALATATGDLKTFVFQPAGKSAREGKKKSVHMDLFHLTGDTDMMNLVGKTICIQTQEGHYGQGNPRPWFVSLVEDGPFKLNTPLPAELKAPQVLANSAANGGQLNNNPPMQQPQQQYGYQPQQYQPQQQQQYGYQPQQYQPQQQWGPNYPTVQAQQYPPMNQGIASAMQQHDVQPQQQMMQSDPVGAGQTYGPDVYDEDMPF